MITFACKTIEEEDLLKCSFNLNKTQYKVFIFLLRQKKEKTIKEISTSLNFDRTTVQKAVKGLLDKELVIKNQVRLKKGGFVYVYIIKDKKGIKKRMINLINSWTKKAKLKIRSL